MDTTSQINTPLVTILMLTYNRAHFLPQAIQSVLDQTYQNFELVVIDDGSTDETAFLMDSYTDKRIHYIQHQHNAGLFVRRAESLSYANGAYTAILDSDDYWCSVSKLAEQVVFLETNPEYVVVGTSAELVDAAGVTIKAYPVATKDTVIRKKLLIRNQFVHSSLLLRTSALEKMPGYKATLAEDLDLVLQLGQHGKLANLPPSYTAHRVHAGSQNDHGRTMAKAVLAIVKNYPNYPNYYLGVGFAYLRLLRSFL